MDAELTEKQMYDSKSVDAGGGQNFGLAYPDLGIVVLNPNALANEFSELLNAEAINNGVHKGLSFSEAFPEQTEANLDELREIFRRKAFKMRQALLLRTLKEIGYKGSELCLLKIDELVAIVSEDHNFSLLRSRYLEVRKEFGGPYGCDKLAFTSDTGEAISSESFVEYLSGLRRVRVNSEFNANMCRSVLKSRYGENTKVATN